MTRSRSIEQGILLEDILIVILSMLLARVAHARLAATVPGLKPPIDAGEYAHLLLVFLPTWVFASERLGLHRLRTLTGPRLDTARRVILTQVWGLAAMAVILVASQTSLNRSLIATFVAISTALLLFAKVFQRRRVIKHRGESTALLVGEAPDVVSAEIQRLGGRRVERCATLDAVELAARLRAAPVDEVVVASRLPAEQLRRLIDLCAEAGLPTLVRIDDAADGTLDQPAPVVETVGTTPYLVYQRRRPDAPSMFAKAILDRTLAAVLIAVLSPLFVVLAVLVFVFIGHPLLYVQRRGGLFGRPFSMLKFRTMRVGAEDEQEHLRAKNEMDGPVFKMRNDPRVTRFGRILRRASLDELPQLFNVLAGQMSLVGPRPLPLEETRALDGGHRRRLAMRPGITCLWQVSGRSELTFAEWMTLDLEYVDTWSLGLDLAILVRTLPAILSARGAR